MRNNAFKLLILIIVSNLLLGCAKNTTDTGPVSLKSAVLSSTQNLNKAVSEIKSAKAFELLSVSSADALKAATVYSANIGLDLVKGQYDYKALNTSGGNKQPLIRFFTKTDNSKIVVNMPTSKLKNPRTLRSYQASDATLANNFSISVSEYHNNYNNYRDFDYVNVADITVDNVKAGSLNIKSFKSPDLGKDYASSFTFENGYTAKYIYKTGEPTTSSFTILNGTAVLYQEEVLTTRDETTEFGHERQYNLTVGDVKIVRKSDKTVEIYVKGTLQPTATVKVIDDDENEGEEHSVCHKRDLLITYEDGTTAKLSALIGQSVTDISTLFTSLHDVYFAAYVVDWLAYDIYYKR